MRLHIPILEIGLVNSITKVNRETEGLFFYSSNPFSRKNSLSFVSIDLI
jgi:hypothetical protein